MIIDFDVLSNKEPLRTEYDVCIVGAGAAGIVLAIELNKEGFSVALCDGGGREISEESQSCYEGSVEGDPYFDLDSSRLRFFGGSTNHWGTWCRTFEAVDFQRSYLGEEYVWPITYSDISVYLNRASEVVEIPEGFLDERFNRSSPINRVEFKFAKVKSFQDKYYKIFEEAEGLDLYLNANLVDINGSSRRIHSATVVNYRKQPFKITAKKFVFSMGGIENSRFLLWFQKKYGNKFFSDELPIGKYWMEHPIFTLGHALVGNDISVNRFYSIIGELQEQNNIMGCCFRVEKYDKKGTKKLINDLICTAPIIGRELLRSAGINFICGVRLIGAWEQAPSANNSVTLSASQKDRFGIPRVILRWKKTEIDRRTIEVSISIFNKWLMESNRGRLKLLNWLNLNKNYPSDDDELAGNHHMGGTRMSHDPKIGVVNSDCRVFGSENLYMAGSSIFTTGGYNNPTLPIIQFAIRLADHLKKIL